MPGPAGPVATITPNGQHPEIAWAKWRAASGHLQNTFAMGCEDHHVVQKEALQPNRIVSLQHADSRIRNVMVILSGLATSGRHEKTLPRRGRNVVHDRAGGGSCGGHQASSLEHTAMSMEQPAIHVEAPLQ